MTSRPLRLTPLAVLVAMAVGCSSSGPSDQSALLTALPRALTSGEQAAIVASNRFGLDLFSRVTAAEADANVFVSPLSITMSLGMVMNGARGATRDGMAVALGFGTLGQSEINTSYRGLLDLLLDLDPTTELAIANSIWTEQTFPIKPAFLSDARTFFDAEARSLDFRSPSAVTTINEWVSQKTRGKIPTILESIEDYEILFAINAVYFKSAWRDRFPVAETALGPFEALDGRRQNASFMHRDRSTPYYAGPDFEAVDLWYGNGAFSMTVLLPKPGANVNDVARRLDPAAWQALTGGLTATKVNLYLPKFRLEYKRRLNRELEDQGMGLAFSDGADLSGIAGDGPGDLFISRVDHKTFVDVNEEGTEAAAVTSTGVGVTSVPVTVTLRVDRPFVFALRERLSGAILFLGRIVAIPGG